MSRLFFVAFMGEEKPENHPHESPWVMTVPLLILAFFSVVGGWVALPEHGFGYFVRYGEFHPHEMDWMVASVSIIAGVLGMGLAYITYVKRVIKAENVVARFPGVYKLLKNKYYIDEIYLWLIRNVMDGIVAKVLYWIDLYIVDGVVNGLAAITRGAGGALRRTTTGQLQTYALVIFFAVVVIYLFFALGEGQLSALNPAAMLGGVK